MRTLPSLQEISAFPRKEKKTMGSEGEMVTIEWREVNSEKKRDQ